ncbi:hypothetical protein HGRIS_008959 [Hohenbuehelia grisea]
MDIWFRLLRVHMPRKSLAEMIDTVSHVVDLFWNADDPPAAAQKFGPFPLANTAFEYVAVYADLLSKLPPNITSQHSVLTGLRSSLGRAQRVMLDKTVTNPIDSRRFAVVMMQILHVLILCHRTPSPDNGATQSIPFTRHDYFSLIISTAWTLCDMYIITSPGIDVVMDLCRFGLLENILGSGLKPGMLQFMPQSQSAHHIMLLEKTLPLYLLYPRGLKAILKATAAIERKGVKPHPPEDQNLPKAWSTFKAEVKKLRVLRDRACTKKSLAFDSCHFPRCKTPKPHTISRCGGCRVAGYCSDQCQRLDWKRHRETCYLFRCGRSDWKELGLRGYLFMAEFEATQKLDSEQLAVLRQEERRHMFADPTYPIVKFSFTWKPISGILTFEDIEEMFKLKYWGASLPVLHAHRRICVLELQAGRFRAPLLSPLMALSFLRRPDLWSIPAYNRL